jgi:hypothetical protein
LRQRFHHGRILRDAMDQVKDPPLVLLDQELKGLFVPFLAFPDEYLIRSRQA